MGIDMTLVVGVLPDGRALEKVCATAWKLAKQALPAIEQLIDYMVVSHSERSRSIVREWLRIESPFYVSFLVRKEGSLIETVRIIVAFSAFLAALLGDACECVLVYNGFTPLLWRRGGRNQLNEDTDLLPITESGLSLAKQLGWHLEMEYPQ